MARDAFAKALYESLFAWIIEQINRAIHVPQRLSRMGKNTLIGVLDIYGFEVLMSKNIKQQDISSVQVFGENSFEQLCINYCNEKLQQLFIDLVLKREQRIYEEEGVKYVGRSTGELKVLISAGCTLSTSTMASSAG